MIEKIPMEGMKVSGDLFLVDVVDTALAGELLTCFLRGLAENRINMNLFIGGEVEGGVQFTCCVAAPDEGRVKALMDGNSELKTGVEFAAPVDLLTLFPHRFDLKILGLGLTALARARIPLHGFCSSLSAITFITGHTDLEKASAALEGCFGLAANAP
jgi:aspartokinase